MALNFGFSTMCGVIIAAENGSVEQRSSGELSGGAKAVIRFLKILGLFLKVYFTITQFLGHRISSDYVEHRAFEMIHTAVVLCYQTVSKKAL